MIQGLFVTHIHVADLQRSTDFYELTLGLEFAYEDPRHVRFYWIGDRGKAMLGIWEKEVPKSSGSTLPFILRWTI